MALFRKKPVVIEARQYDGSLASASALCRWINSFDDGTDDPTASFLTDDRTPGKPEDFQIMTLEGPHLVTSGDWIIKGVKGEFYPCKPDIFAATYEPGSSAPSTPGGRP